jgi:hypothetical protein
MGKLAVLGPEEFVEVVGDAVSRLKTLDHLLAEELLNSTLIIGFHPEYALRSADARVVVFNETAMSGGSEGLLAVFVFEACFERIRHRTNGRWRFLRSKSAAEKWLKQQGFDLELLNCFFANDR